MITEIHLRDFRIHRDTLLEGLGPLVAIVGPNASGKTNLLRALTLPVDPSDARPKGFGPSYVIQDEAKLWLDVKSQQTGTDSPSQLIRRFLKLDGGQIGAVSIMRETPPNMASDGWGLASCIRYLLTTDRAKVDDLFRVARQIIPALSRGREPKVEAVKLREAVDGWAVTALHERCYAKSGVSSEIASLAVNDTIGADELWLAGRPANQASEGTLICLAILTEMIMTQGTVLIDDIDQGLHPAAQRELITALRQLTELKSKAQVIMTTHSPYIIDQLTPEEVWVFQPDAEGYTSAKRLSDHPDAKRALDVLTTGEFWSAEGEAWVAAPVSHG